MANKSHDTIMAELVAAGYLTGTISDREYARLLFITAASPVGKTMADLYFLAGEKPRL